MKYDLTTIGEGQIRLTVPHGQHLARTQQLRMTAACSEANVAGLLSQLGRSTAWCSRLPRSDLAERCLSEFRSVGVDMSAMIRTDEGRMALYFMEPGEAPMPSRVTYDRLHTPFRDITPEMVDWNLMLDTKLVFVTGITAALTENTASVIKYFVDAAVDKGIDVALDVNYRGLLWSPEQAREVLSPIASKSRIIFCSRRDAAIVFGIEGDKSECSRKVREQFGAEHVVSTDQTEGVYHAGPDGELNYEVVRVPVVDRPGAGDAFVAATLHGFIDDDVTAGIGYGLQVSKYALTHHGDLTYITPELLALAKTTDIIR
jgi:2-dehydro-3-deoxygluconokinase